MINSQEKIERVNISLKNCLAQDENIVQSSLSECYDILVEYIKSEDGILRFEDPQTFELIYSSNALTKQFQLFLGKKFTAFIEILFDTLISERKLKTKIVALSHLWKISFIKTKYSKLSKDSSNKFYDLNEAILVRLWQTFQKINQDEIGHFFGFISKYLDLTLVSLSKFHKDMMDSKSEVNESYYFIYFKFFSNLSEDFPSSIFSHFMENPLKRKSEPTDINIIRNEYGNQIKNLFSSCLLHFLKKIVLKNEEMTYILKNFSKKILPYIDNPLLFSDFLLNIFFLNPDFDLKILSLSILFILIAKHSLELENYYEILFELLSSQLISLEIFKSKYKKRFYKVLESSLRTSKLSLNLLVKFLKVISKLALKAGPNDMLWLTGLTFNLIKKNEILIYLIKEKFIFDSKSKINAGLDDNLFNETLWELNSLKNHYSKEVKHVMKFFENIEDIDFMNLEDFNSLDMKSYYETLIEKKLSDKIKVMKNFESANLDQGLSLFRSLKYGE